MFETVMYERERIEPRVDGNPLALFRALPLALALSAFGWGLLAGISYGLYLLFA